MDGSRGSQQVALRAAEEPSVNTRAQAVDFLATNLSTKYALVEGLTKSWALAPFGLAEPLKITEERVAIDEVRPSLLLLPFIVLLALEYFTRQLLGN